MKLSFSQQFTTETWGIDEITVRDVDGIEAPVFWSDNAVNIVRTKYLKPWEKSIRSLILRVADQITQWGVEQGYFDEGSALIFNRELQYILVYQMAAFNSPVWFNVGAEDNPQTSACFILGVEDSMEGILEWYRQEAMLFKWGSGAGVNISSLRGKDEPLSCGGKASGPLSFMKAADASAGVIKSGGKNRRAAKLVCMDLNHPDILDFVRCKVVEEEKMRVLERSGYSGGIDGEAPGTVAYQNSNHSVRVSNAFMSALKSGTIWGTRYVKSGETAHVYDASTLLHEIAAAIHACGDPGVQFHDTINRWHTCPNSGPITSSNPCFVGETLIDTSEGFITIEELARKNAHNQALPMAFTFDTDTQLPVLRQITDAWQSKYVSLLLEITTEKGIKVRCTPEHPFLTKTGQYVAAQKLFIGQRLRKIGRWINTERNNRMCINHRETPACPNGTTFQNRFMWEQAYGTIPPGHDVHHKNNDPTDDRLSNFELKENRVHKSGHTIGANNPRFINIDHDFLARVWPIFEERCRGKCTVWRWNRFLSDYNLRGLLPHARYVDGIPLVQDGTWEQFCERADALCDAANDKVAQITKLHLDNPVPVYDLTVKGTHSFAVTSPGVVHSVVVHNCSEFMFIDNSACNLASIRLTKFWTPRKGFDWHHFRHVIEIMVTAMDIVIDKSSYPTDQIAENAHRFRPLGLGYTDLGALLMRAGLPYDSDQARQWATSITSFMTASAYRASIELASVLGTFDAYNENAREMLDIIERHRKAAPAESMAKALWDAVVHAGWQSGFRNAQASLLAPTGTISFMMDCDTTGIEPEFSLVRIKALVDGPSLTITSNSIEPALEAMSIPQKQFDAIHAYIKELGGVEGCDLLTEEQQEVFDSAIPMPGGQHCVSPEAHLLMMAAVQPHLSGAISKTVNVPTDTTVEEIEQLIVRAWDLGLKSVAIYRDGSKAAQPLTSGTQTSPQPIFESVDDTDWTSPESLDKAITLTIQPQRVKLPADCQGDRHRFEFGGLKGYIHTGVDDDGYVREIFVRVAKAGSTLSGLIDALSIVVSMALQYGVPLEALVKKLSHIRFEPSGFTDNPEIRTAKSLVDYIFQYLGLKYLSAEARHSNSIVPEIWRAETDGEAEPMETATTDAPMCSECGAQMIRAGSCYACRGCGATTGCG